MSFILRFTDTTDSPPRSLKNNDDSGEWTLMNNNLLCFKIVIIMSLSKRGRRYVSLILVPAKRVVATTID